MPKEREEEEDNEDEEGKDEGEDEDEENECLQFEVSVLSWLDTYPTAITSLEFLSVTKLFTMVFSPDSTTWKQEVTRVSKNKSYEIAHFSLFFLLCELLTSGGTNSWQAWAKQVSSFVTSKDKQRTNIKEGNKCTSWHYFAKRWNPNKI